MILLDYLSEQPQLQLQRVVVTLPIEDRKGFHLAYPHMDMETGIPCYLRWLELHTISYKALLRMLQIPSRDKLHFLMGPLNLLSQKTSDLPIQTIGHTIGSHKEQ